MLQNRPGAVHAMQLASAHFPTSAHMLVIGGDTLLLDDFSLAHVFAQYQDVIRAHGDDVSVLLTYNTNDEGTRKSGILELDDAGRVTAFLEKPGMCGCVCVYVCTSMCVCVYVCVCVCMCVNLLMNECMHIKYGRVCMYECLLTHSYPQVP